MAETYPAPPEILERVERIANAYHPHLRDARLKIGVREKTPTIMHALTWGEVDTPNNDAEARAFDFSIWFALDAWATLDNTQRDALVDHELSHCIWDDEGKPKLNGHEIEEFNGVLERYGLWWPDVLITPAAILKMAETGQKGATMPEYVTEHNMGSFGGGNHGSSGAGNHGSSGAGNHGSSGAYGSPLDALVEHALMIRAKLREGGFSEIETGRISDTYLRHWLATISEGNHGSSGA